MNRNEMLRAFISGYLHGRSSLGDHEPAGREAEAAFNRWWPDFQKLNTAKPGGPNAIETIE